MIPIIILSIENEDDREYMGALYEELYPVMKSTALEIVKESPIADDVIQDALVALIRGVGTIRNLNRNSLKSYVVRVVRNKAIDYYNKYMKKGINSYYENEDCSDPIADDTYAPAEQFEALETYEELGEAMKLLAERDRDILYMKYNMEMGDKEIGETMGIKKNSVRQYLTRARRNAKEVLSKRGGTDE